MSVYGARIRPAAGEPWVLVAEGYDPQTGPTRTYEWRSGIEAEILAVKEFHEAFKRKTELRRPVFGEEPKEFILQVTTGAAETADLTVPLLEKWSLKRNFFEKNLWEHKKIGAIFNRLLEGKPFPPAEGESDIRRFISELRKDFDAFVRGDKTTDLSELDGEPAPLTTGILSARLLSAEISAPDEVNVFVDFLKARLNGVEASPEFAYVLRKQTVIYNNSTFEPDRENLGKMFTLASLQSSEGLDDQRVIRIMPTDGFWLKTPMELDDMDADKIEVSQEYWHSDAFEKFLFEEA